MTIHIVMGPPCADKTTWIAEQRSEDEPVVDYDALAHALGSSEHHDPPEAIGQAAFAARVAAVARIFDGGIHRHPARRRMTSPHHSSYPSTPPVTEVMDHPSFTRLMRAQLATRF